ncbi:LIC_10091 family protein [Nannocystis pusilla]|uniref:LIC_10091 family protein n=1 Tax=Nannocystis pusilla TaxID=889268 RepID=UPI003DA3F181
MRRLLPAVFALALLPAAARADVDEFTAAARRLAADADTGPLTNGLHYFASNERDLDLVADAVQDTGGVVVAVAADPGYILAAWADARALVLIDLDPAIVALHRIYAAFFAAAPGPAEFSRLWTPAGEAEALALVKAAGGAALVETFVAARPAVARRFAELGRHMASQGRAWLLSDPRLYARVAGLVRANRVIALRGDFTRAGTVRAVGEALRAADLRVGLLYLSNIEQYFLYTPEFRQNVQGLPLAGGQVLRTLPGRPAGFEYILQQGADFQAWAQNPKVRSVYRIRGFKKGEHLISRRVHVVDPARPRP